MYTHIHIYIFFFSLHTPKSSILARKYALFSRFLSFFLSILVLDLLIRIRRQNDRGWQKAQYLGGSANQLYLRPLVVSSALPSRSSVHFTVYTVPTLTCLSYARSFHVATRETATWRKNEASALNSFLIRTTDRRRRRFSLVDVTLLFRRT